MSNRVEDLESQVAELQAAVNGLTEELVEMKERVRQLEQQHEADAQPATDEDSTEKATPAERTTKSDVHADVVETDVDAAETDVDAVEADDGNDLVVAGEDEVSTSDGGADGEDDVEAPKSEGNESGEDDGESEDSDIIVA